MSQLIPTIKALVNLWPTRAALAADLNASSPRLSVTVHQVHKWAEKGCIPAKYHHPLLLAARAREFPVSAELLVELHAPSEDAA
ncbi:hypothetical protein [Marinovum algicola]|uniref:hypothetical protein n=1 Tax=Marinovum algicola TaxID=42444 RepID=UPI0024BBE2B9|nr:hypothetical protein [Marinovum algicola]